LHDRNACVYSMLSVSREVHQIMIPITHYDNSLVGFENLNTILYRLKLLKPKRFQSAQIAFIDKPQCFSHLQFC
jgi:hypothetical protein